MHSISIKSCPSKPYRFDAPFVGEEYTLLLYVSATDVSVEDQAKIGDEIVASGCRFAVCYGHRCSTWEDSIDWASVAAHREEGSLVMTTCHEDEAPEDVAEFFWHHTSFEGFSANRKGIFILGPLSDLEIALKNAITTLNEKTG
jgi:hypothetical protein